MTLLEEWREFERNIVPADVDQIMRSKMRFLFYSGALCVFDRLPLTEAVPGRLVELHSQLQELASEVAKCEREKIHGRPWVNE